MFDNETVSCLFLQTLSLWKGWYHQHVSLNSIHNIIFSTAWCLANCWFIAGLGGCS